MKWTIVFDSGCDLRNFDPIPSADLKLVPLTLLVGEHQVVDDGTTSLEDFQALLDREKGRTGSACPSVGDWQHIMEDCENCIVITLAATLSGSYQSACIARDMVLENQPDRNIFVLDSCSASAGMQFMVDKAIELVEQDCDFATVCRELEVMREHTKVFLMLQNVDNLISNGRLNIVLGKALKALRLCIVGNLSPDGTLSVTGKVRDMNAAMEKAISQAVECGCTGRRLRVTHCLNPEGAKVLENKLRQRFPDADIQVQRNALLCGYYVEKGGLLLSFTE